MTVNLLQNIYCYLDYITTLLLLPLARLFCLLLNNGVLKLNEVKFEYIEIVCTLQYGPETLAPRSVRPVRT